MSASSLRLFHKIQLAAHRLKKTADRALVEAAGITVAQAAVLTLVADRQPVSQKAVAAALGFNESAVTAMVRRLLADGLLERERAAEDARAWRLRLSAAGSEALAAARGPFNDINAAIDSALRETDDAAFAAALDRLAARFRGA
ncbi:MarR family transcriptional regulator [Marinicauda salina]|uniref:MarR family transcriptional regulator n=1 Tax=Marinicauda salina TaxID=2135793 RepID=A0A2U2BU02_9PROT|nr:helix-turn-helix domain-containing protein [Marinicauda salina]PWE17460.1 MarR family transcriptional regulator [Marinicauda salina]